MNKIGIIGLGNMGEAVLKALLRGGYKADNILYSEIKSERIEAINNLYGIKHEKSIEGLVKKVKYVVLAIKPQDSKDIITRIAPFIDDKKVIVSIMAGITTSNILSIIGKPVQIIRAMPNICAKVGEGAIGITANSTTEKKEFEQVVNIFNCLGKVIEVGEELMDAITALGASGPAFFLLFLEAMIDAGVKMGIPRDKSRILSIQVVKGTLKMLVEEGIHPSLMREMITSPGGTTISGLAHLEERAFKGNIIIAIEKAAKRAEELSI